LGTPKTNKMSRGKLKILKIDETGRVSNKKIDIKYISKIKLSPKNLKKFLEEIVEVELWCRKNK
jgi:hypothetical protein